MFWLYVFLTCTAACIVGNILSALMVAWHLGRAESNELEDKINSADHVARQFKGMQPYPLDENGKLREPAPDDEYDENDNLRL